MINLGKRGTDFKDNWDVVLLIQNNRKYFGKNIFGGRCCICQKVLPTKISYVKMIQARKSVEITLTDILS